MDGLRRERRLEKIVKKIKCIGREATKDGRRKTRRLDGMKRRRRRMKRKLEGTE